MTTVIATRGLTKDYQYRRQRPGLTGAVAGLFQRTSATRRALDTLDLDVAAGELVGLLGRNGAGKTTTIKLCCGLLRPTSGQVRVLGHEPWRRQFAFLRRISVVLGQKSMLWWDVSPMDSYLVHQAMYDLEPTAFDRRVAELGELLTVRDVLDIPVRKLSLGQRMKCELLASLLHRPEVLFLDEPTIGLDVISTAAVREFLREVNQRDRTTIVLTSHNMDDVEQLCERVVLIDEGRLGYDGTLTELVRRTRPAKQVRLTYASEPMLGERLPPGVTVLRADGPLLALSAEREQVNAIMAACPTWGDLVDVEIADADLDDVMRTVLSGPMAADDR